MKIDFVEWGERLRVVYLRRGRMRVSIVQDHGHTPRVAIWPSTGLNTKDCNELSVLLVEADDLSDDMRIEPWRRLSRYQAKRWVTRKVGIARMERAGVPVKGLR